MRTRKMNTRITFFSERGGQNEDGEVISPIRKNLYTCWAEVAKASLKDFQEGARQAANKRAKGLLEATDVKSFYIRHNPERPFDNADHVEYKGFEYDIIGIQPDEASHDVDMVTVSRRI